MIKTKTFVVKGEIFLNGPESAVEKLDKMINGFIEEKNAESPSFGIVEIQYRPTIEANQCYYYPSAMLVYDEDEA
jgi:hypothetical protein